MRKQFALFALLMIFAGKSFSQSVTISGPSTVAPSSSEMYTATVNYSLHPYTIIQWWAVGGTVTYATINPTIPNDLYCIVQWDNQDGNGYVVFYEDLGGGYCEYPVLIQSRLQAKAPDNYVQQRDGLAKQNWRFRPL